MVGMTPTVRRAIAALTALGLSTLSPSSTAADRFEPLRREIRQAVEAGEVVSLAVGVARGDEILWEEAFGWADAETRRPATVHTPYSLASVSKPFTATALMVLVDRGRVELDRGVNDYLGEARLSVGAGDPQAATVRQVASHTAGLPLYHQFYLLADGGPPPVDEALRRYAFLVTPPGERFRYSNLGYGVLERVIEQVSGRTLARFLETEVFRPLGLEHTTLVADPEALPGRARRHGWKGELLPAYDTDHRGGSSVWACVHDLLRFGAFHLGRSPEELPEDPDSRRPRETTTFAPVLSESARREMQRPVSQRPEWGGGYGLGWSVAERRRRRVIFHTGGMPGVSASLALVPAGRWVVAVVANSRSDLPLRVSDEIVDELAVHFRLGAWAWAGSGDSEPQGLRRRVPRRFRGHWQGTVRLPSGERQLLALEIGKKEVAIAGPDGATTPHPAGTRDGELRALVRWRLDPARSTPGLYQLSLYRRGDRLTGALVEISGHPPGFPRAVSHWVELARE